MNMRPAETQLSSQLAACKKCFLCMRMRAAGMRFFAREFCLLLLDLIRFLESQRHIPGSFQDYFENSPGLSWE